MPLLISKEVTSISSSSNKTPLLPKITFKRGIYTRVSISNKFSSLIARSKDYYNSKFKISKIIILSKTPRKKNPKEVYLIKFMIKALIVDLVAKSAIPDLYYYIVKVLTILLNDIDNTGANKPSSLKEAIKRLN